MPRLLAPLAVAVLSAAVAPAAADVAGFTVLRDGTPIGTHRIAVTRNGAETRVEVAIDLQVRFALVTVYRYSHRNREVWRDGHLVRIEAETDDNGARSFVRGRATPAGFAVDATAGRFTAPADIVPTSYWNRAGVTRDRLLDTQTGRLVTIRAERSTAGGEALYRLRGELDVDLWYDGTDRLRRIAFDYKGARFDYVPEARAAAGEPDA